MRGRMRFCPRFFKHGYDVTLVWYFEYVLLIFFIFLHGFSFDFHGFSFGFSIVQLGQRTDEAVVGRESPNRYHLLERVS